MEPSYFFDQPLNPNAPVFVPRSYYNLEDDYDYYADPPGVLLLVNPYAERPELDDFDNDLDNDLISKIDQDVVKLVENFDGFERKEMFGEEIRLVKTPNTLVDGRAL